MKKITVVAIIFLFLVILSRCVSQVDAPPLWEEGKAQSFRRYVRFQLLCNTG